MTRYPIQIEEAILKTIVNAINREPGFAAEYSSVYNEIFVDIDGITTTLFFKMSYSPSR